MAISLNEFDYLRELVLTHSAIAIESGKEYLAESRLAQLAYVEGQTSVNALLTNMRGKPFGTLHRKVLDAMTNNETWFFRDLHPFEMIKRKVLPELIVSRGTLRRLNIWSAASSSGQEAYSLAMMIEDEFPELRSWTVRILGTDISSAILNRARGGRYTQMEVNRGLPAPLLTRHFRREGLEWVIKDSIRSRVSFEAINLSNPWQAMATMDIIMLRNVLIYFEVPMKKQILARARNVLHPDGYLFLGSAESMMGLDDGFERVEYGKASCYRLRR
ncbi:MCP methyltransferase, CheR-type [Candidatus Koribacter versatilis Ellin345]|uniref:protein-glutamate O-methyltransferase n=1 Tax=Koribacter versatilis (strain Ellin345) TaxID=204669 RepID=Q1IRG9_KORVE|nr:protein-glutamate O-methyltransferase CheR [Candidatus Koribacter versatilis]ABF40531.1 MCP methyltransferase, CheR-type [Candidatus Koribacter versatilis Ellin345]